MTDVYAALTMLKQFIYTCDISDRYLRCVSVGSSFSVHQSASMSIINTGERVDWLSF